MAGICGTDLHVVAGHFTGVEQGAVIGHELLGELRIAVGSGVTQIKVGDQVVASDFTACGHGWWCARGDHWECPDRAFFGTGNSFGPSLSGAQAEDRARAVRRYDAGEDTQWCQRRSGDPGQRQSRHRMGGDRAGARLEPGESVAVIGGGTVGQLCKPRRAGGRSQRGWTGGRAKRSA